MKKKLILPFILALSLLLCQIPAFAASGSASLSANPQTVAVGDVFDIAVSFSSKGEAIGSLQAKLQYDASAMKYMSGGGNAVEISGGTGGIAAVGDSDVYNFTYVLRFTALKAGSASFQIKDCEIIGFDSGADIGGGSKKVSVKIGNLATPAPVATDEPADTPDPAESLEPSESPSPSEEPEDEPIPVDINGKTAYILRDFGGMSLPSGFTQSLFSHEGVEVVSAVNEDLGVTLVCVMDAAGNTGLYVYGNSGSSLIPYVRIEDNNTYVLAEPESEPAGFSRTTLTYEGAQITAWDTGDGGLPLVYALNSRGEGGFYYINTEDGALLKAVLAPQSGPEESAVPTPAPTETASPTPSSTAQSAPSSASYSPWQDSSALVVLYVLIGLAVLLAAALVLVKINKRKNR